jgi:Zn-dependent M28 family amino/carboxypeptidase
MTATRRLAALLLAAAVGLSACGASANPTSAAPAEQSAGGTALAERLRDAVSVDNIVADLDALQKIADDNGGNRADGLPGYEASVNLVEQRLRDLGYDVRRDTLTIPLFHEEGQTLLEIPGAPAFQMGRDFKAMLFSASAELTARIVPIGFDRNADPLTFPEHPTGRGCAGDMPDEVRGAIVLVQPGSCFRRAQVETAQAHGAAAIIMSYPQWQPDSVLRPTLLIPDGVSIPVIGATRQVGLALAHAADRAASVHLKVRTRIEDKQVANVIAETRGGDASRVVMLGGHLDSALDGPGINDNGSGTMTLLELARRLADSGSPPVKVRFAFWAGEELGLYGSSHYIEGLSDGDRDAIAVYLNFDMLASPNGGRMVYDDSSGPAGSERVTQLFAGYFDAAGLSHQELDLSAGSDHFGFERAGIPVGGLFTGANEAKGGEGAQRVAGRADELFDPCYHRACDRTDNVNRPLLEQMARAVAYVTGQLASGQVQVRG